MTMLFCDSFDHYASAQLTHKWTAIGTGTTIVAATGRRGTQAAKVSSTNHYLQKTFGTYYSTLVTGFSLNYSAKSAGDQAHGLLALQEGATIHLSVALKADGSVVVVLGGYATGTVLATATGTLALGSTTYIEFKATIHDTTGSFELRFNGATVASASGIDTRNAGALGQVNNIKYAYTTYTYAATLYVDDLYINDTAGSANNNFLGDIRIDCVMPNADGTYLDGTPSTGTTHYTLVDEIPPTATDYVSLTTTGHKDSYGFADMPSVGTSSIKAVQVVGSMLKSDAASRGASSVVKSGATTAYGTSRALSTSQTMYTYIHETDPNTSAAWTEANVNAAEFGFQADA